MCYLTCCVRLRGARLVRQWHVLTGVTVRVRLERWTSWSVAVVNTAADRSALATYLE